MRPHNTNVRFFETYPVRSPGRTRHRFRPEENTHVYTRIVRTGLTELDLVTMTGPIKYTVFLIVDQSTGTRTCMYTCVCVCINDDNNNNNIADRLLCHFGNRTGIDLTTEMMCVFKRTNVNRKKNRSGGLLTKY